MEFLLERSLQPERQQDFAERIVEILHGDRIWKDIADRKANFWDVIEYGRDSYETRYSRMLRWLLDPAETHGLGTYFLDGFIALADVTEPDGSPYSGPPIAFQRAQTTASVEVATQKSHHRASRRLVDIVVDDPGSRTLLVIENKVGAKDSVDQLDDYHAWATAQAAPFAGYRKAFVFLTIGTPDENGGWQPDAPVNSDPEGRWCRISYRQLEPLLEGAILRAVWNSDRHTQKIIEDFLFDIQDISGKRESHYLSHLFSDDETHHDTNTAATLDYGYGFEIATLARHFTFRMNDAEGKTSEVTNYKRDRWGSLLAFVDAAIDANRIDPADFFASITRRVESLWGKPIDPLQYRKLAETLWRAHPRDKITDHSANPIAQKFARMIFNEIVHSETAPLQLHEPERFGTESKAERTRPVLHPDFAAIGVTHVRITGTRNGGQAMNLDLAALNLSVWLAVGKQANVPDVCGWLFINPQPGWVGAEKGALIPRKLYGSVADLDVNDDEALSGARDALLNELLTQLRSNEGFLAAVAQARLLQGQPAHAE